MKKEEFIRLIDNAKVDEKGNLYYIDDSLGINNRVYFATIQFTSKDDTLNINIVNK